MSIVILIDFWDCGTPDTIATTLIASHRIVIEAPVLFAVLSDSRDLAILTQVGRIRQKATSRDDYGEARDRVQWKESNLPRAA